MADEGDPPRSARGGTLVIRAPNHLGDLVLALPALARSGADAIVVRRPLAALLQMAALPGQVIPLDRGIRSVVVTARRLRREHFDRGVLLTPSLSSALVFALAGITNRRGTATDGRSPLLTERIEAPELAGAHRASSYMMLVGAPRPETPPVPRLEPGAAARDEWRALAGDGSKLVGIFPGSNASSRRWSPARFGALTGQLTRAGMRVVVFGGPAEKELTAEAAGDSGIDLGGRTGLPLLAAGLAACTLLVTNDSGPMHLAAAVGTPTISLWGAGDPAETGPLGSGHRILRHVEVPCVPCRMNHCPRSGQGTILPNAERECLELITVDEVMNAVSAQS